MRAIARFGLVTLTVVASTVATACLSQAQVGKTATTTTATTKAAGAPARPADFNMPLATVNGAAITKGELINFLSRYQIPQGSEEQAYKDAVETLINTRLVSQFLLRQKIAAPEEKVTQAIETLKKQLAADGTDLASEILRSGMSMDDVRKEYTSRIRWVEYVDKKATDGELKRFAESHKDLFSGTQVRASHILVKVEPKATAAEKDAARKKLAGIKDSITSKKMTFAQAANKFSEDPANSEGAGGDVGYFTLNSGFIEEFANAAFAMKSGDISDTIETPYGYHLIQVTDRKEGKELDFDQNKLLVKQLYAAELQKTLLSAERKTAKIDIKPMPANFFPAAPAVTAPATPPATTKPAAPK